MSEKSWPSRRDSAETCERKRRHGSWEEAREAALAVWVENPRDKDVNMAEPYLCWWCGSYHIGH